MAGNVKLEPILTKETAFVIYETTLEQIRTRFAEILAPILSDDDPRTALLFWIYFSAQGVGMTEPVEGWIRRAGNKCQELGYQELGTQLLKHAVHEADHHLLMIEDTQRLVRKWNQSNKPKLDADTVLKQPSRKPVLQYQNLHENYISGKQPYCQIAIEYEIENLSATYGTGVLKHTFKVLGEDIKNCLSFLDDHVKIDVAHTQFNRKVISSFLTSYPEVVHDLIYAGKEALTIYGSFLTDCYQQALNS